jgi:hypothetical protein
MRRTRRTITILVFLALAGCSLSSAAADAGSLLSGYGGPGQGNQAILGSALINGPSGKGGSGGSRSSSAGGPTSIPATSGNGSLIAPSSTAGAGRATTPAGRAGKASAGAAGGARRSGAAGKGAGRTSASGSRAYTKSSEPARATGGSQPLGLSGADLGYILLALAVLAFTGVLTRRLARQPVSG